VRAGGYAGARGAAIARVAVSRQLSLFASDIALPLWLGSRPQIWPCGTPGRSANPRTVTDCRSRQALPGRGDRKVGSGTDGHAEIRGGRRADFAQVGLMTTTCKMCGPRDIAVLQPQQSVSIGVRP
jgi:hypothetical protein